MDDELLKLEYAVLWLSTELHRTHFKHGVGAGYCVHCNYAWPCPTEVAWRQLLQTIDRAARQLADDEPADLVLADGA